MNKKKVIFWVIIAVIVVAIVCFLKYNPLYATAEVIIAFCLGFFGEWIVNTIYDKWVKAEEVSAESDEVTEEAGDESTEDEDTNA